MYVKARLQEMQCQIEKFRGTGNARQLAVGGLFQLADYYRSDQNKEYLVIAASYEMEGAARRSGSQGSTQNPYV
jgi:type VI secretion system secreted protein VgrG